jgi:hypothetical protein
MGLDAKASYRIAFRACHCLRGHLQATGFLERVASRQM